MVPHHLIRPDSDIQLGAPTVESEPDHATLGALTYRGRRRQQRLLLRPVLAGLRLRLLAALPASAAVRLPATGTAALRPAGTSTIGGTGRIARGRRRSRRG